MFDKMEFDPSLVTTNLDWVEGVLKVSSSNNGWAWYFGVENK